MKAFFNIVLAGLLSLTLSACPQPMGEFVVNAIAGAGGTIAPQNQSVAQGAVVALTVTPNVSFTISSVIGCGGTLAGNTYTTAPITTSCTVNATFVALPTASTGNTSFDVTGAGVLQAGRTSRYRVSGLPAPVAGRPLVIYLHGDGGNNIQVPTAYSDWSDHQAAVIVAPQGLGAVATWNFRMDGRKGNATPNIQPPLDIDDVAFIKEIITRGTNAGTPLFGAGNKIDPTKVFVVGESRGGGMAYVVYAHPDTKNLITAIAPISGTFFCATSNSGNGTLPYFPPVDSDLVCGENGGFGYFAPKASLYTRTNAPRIFNIHGSNDLPQTAAPDLDDQFGNLINMTKQWAITSSSCGALLPSANPVFANATINGKTVSAYRQRNATNTAPCAADITYFIVQAGGHVPSGYAERVVKWFFGKYDTATNTFTP